MFAPVIDLRSDTVTMPSDRMREFMARAEVGDDVYDEDPTLRELEEFGAELTGKEAGLFLPSGTMANVIAQMVHAAPGDEVIVGDKSHAVLYEVGAGPRLAGVQYQVIAGSMQPTAAEIAMRIKAPTFHTPGTGLVWVENTHNMAGGVVYPNEELEKIAALCREHDLPLHMDGARVFNAAVALGVPVREITRHVDSVGFCLSKGLGAPVGSLLCGSAAFRAVAHRTRKMLGGGMRQAGIIAAAGLLSLRENVDRLAEDHALACHLAESVAAIDGLTVDLPSPPTNIVMADLACGDASAFAERCKQRGVLFHALEAGRVRFVTHLDLTRDDVDRALEIIRSEA